MNGVKFKREDFLSNSAHVSRTINFLENSPHRLLDLCATTARVYGQTEFADKLETADGALTLALIPGDVYAVCRGASAFDARAFARSVCSLTSDGTVALQFVGVAAPFAAAAPYCDIWVYGNDSVENFQKMNADIVEDSHNLYVRQRNKNFWELGKNMILLASAIAAVAGVIFPAIVLAALSVSVLLFSLRAFLIEKAMMDDIATAGLDGIYNVK